MYDIDIAPQAVEDLKGFRKFDQSRIAEGIEEQLRHQPAVETRNRKRLRPGHLTEWELRIGNFRVLYDVDQEASLIRVVTIGYKKGNKLFFRGQEYSP